MSGFQFYALLYISIVGVPEIPILTYVLSIWPYTAFTKLIAYQF
jgi:hypothetical protein